MITFEHEIIPTEANYHILTLAKDYKKAHKDKIDKMPEPNSEIMVIWNDGEPIVKRTHKDPKTPFRIDGLAALYKAKHVEEGMRLEVSYDPDKKVVHITTNTGNKEVSNSENAQNSERVHSLEDGGAIQGKDAEKNEDPTEMAPKMEWGKEDENGELKEGLLSRKRLSDGNDTGYESVWDGLDTMAYDVDYLSIVSSQAFRRLQDKTQVFPLDKSDFVRTRLTHTIEVSNIAQQIATLVGGKNKVPEENIPWICSIVACAGLLHDTGNPPFGHYGEECIRNWFKQKFADENFVFEDYEKNNKPTIVGGNLGLDEQMKQDFTRFEGNAQGLRIISKSFAKKEGHDMDLTYAVMNTLIKYPNPSHDKDINSNSEDVKMHKNGYYHSEEEIIKMICENTGTLIGGKYVRHPLVYIMEAADDIAYATADLEDSVVKKSFSLKEFAEHCEKAMSLIKKYADKVGKSIEGITIYDQFNKIQDIVKTKEEEKDKDKDKETVFAEYENWLTDLRGYLIGCAARTFRKNYGNIMMGKYLGDLFPADNYDDDEDEWKKKEEGNEGGNVLKALKKIMSDYVYDSDEIVEMELGAKKILETLLDTFVPAAMYYNEFLDMELEKKKLEKKIDKGEKERIKERIKFIKKNARHMNAVQDRFIHKIPDYLLKDYQAVKKKLDNDFRKKRIDEDKLKRELLYHRILIATDYISGMTDSYAANLYQTINGEVR